MVAEIIEKYQSGTSLRKLAHDFGIERRRIKSLLIENGVAIRDRLSSANLRFKESPWRDKDLIVDLYETQGKSTIEIAKHLMCDRSVIVDWLHRFGVKMRTTADTQKGRTPANAGKGKRSSLETIMCACGCGTEIMRFARNSCEVKFAKGHRIRGEKHPMYKPKSKNSRKHEGSEYRQWRKAVLSASNYTCNCCGKVGGKLESHHVASVSEHPEYMLDVGNGRAMCKPCHVEVHVAFREIFNANSK